MFSVVGSYEILLDAWDFIFIFEREGRHANAKAQEAVHPPNKIFVK